MKKTKISIMAISAILAVAFFVRASDASAATPTLKLTSTGDGDTVQIDVTGNPGSAVVFYYTKKDLGPFVSSLGTTDANGAFTTTISAATYNVTPSSMVHVIVGGLQSADMSWPYISAGTMISLSKTSMILSLGQATTITAYNNGTNQLFLSNNSNPPIANVNISGNQVTVTALNYGATMVTVCSQTSQSTCASAYVNVQNGGTALSFSQNNVSVVSGQSVSVSVFGGSGTYIITNNQNAGVIQSSLSGTTVTLNGLGTSGSSAVTVCSSDMSSCGIINANIGNVNSQGLTLSQVNTSLTAGQNANITITGGADGIYSVYANSNPNIVQASISGSSLLLSGLSGGSSVVTVCSSIGKCGSVTATVLGNTSGGGAITLSQNNLWLSVGQSMGITISGGAMPYSAPANPDGILSSSINNSILTITGVKPGSTSLSVCSAGGGCTLLSVLVNGTTNNNAITLATSSVSVGVGIAKPVAIFGNGGYFVANNTDSSIDTASITGSNVIVTGLKIGSSSVSICQNGGQCAVLTVSVTAAPAATVPEITPIVTGGQQSQTVNYPDNTLVRDQKGRIFVVVGNKKMRITTLAELRARFAGKKINDITDIIAALIPDAPATTTKNYVFTKMLAYGSIGDDVKKLQERLASEGFFTDTPTGRYYGITAAAVKKYQAAKGIRQTGTVGNLTMAALNK